MPDLAPAAPRLGPVRLLLAVAGLLFLALVLPPAVAVGVNRGRIADAGREAASLAERVRQARAWSEGPRRLPGDAPGFLADVLIGPGEEPREAGGEAWHRGRVSSLADAIASPVPPDPWGNHYLVNIGAGRAPAGAGSGPNAVWVLSAGPNGTIETPIELDATRAALGGDDVGARVR